jgi:hypothetical protein
VANPISSRDFVQGLIGALERIRANQWWRFSTSDGRTHSDDCEHEDCIADRALAAAGNREGLRSDEELRATLHRFAMTADGPRYISALDRVLEGIDGALFGRASTTATKEG